MKKILLKLHVGVVPFVLCIALMITAFLSIQTNNNLQGNARVINYAGIVRGATQRLIKKELNHNADDHLITKLDIILTGLLQGSDELNLERLEDENYQSSLEKMQKEWSDIKKEILRYRQGANGDTLFALSEDYFDLADRTVLAAEVYAEENIQNTRNLLLYVNIVFILIAGTCTLFAYYQDKRRRSLIEAETKNRLKSERLTKQFQEILASINEITELMYVSDIETYDLLFINEAGKRMFHVNELTNQKCYKVLQGFDGPCSFCPNMTLSKDETYSWEYTNPLTKGHYLLKDRLMDWEGRPAKMEIAFDITEATNEKIELRESLERDGILVECIRELYMNHDSLEATKNILKQVGELFLSDRAYIFMFYGERIANIAEWCKMGITPQIQNLQNLSKSDFAIWMKILEKQEYISVKNLEDIKFTMEEEYEFIRQQGIQRIIIVPLIRDDKMVGCIGLDNLSIHLFDNAATFLETLSYFIMLAMHRNENEKALYQLSYLDTLTSFYNRNRYMQDIAEIEDNDTSIGIVYVDVNGLKEINDHLGHDAGDNLLKKCSKIIRASYMTSSCYRIGGDEFVIICKGISESEFHTSVLQLKHNFEQSDCKAAIGYKWESNCSDIEMTIKKADEFMYADKKEFYHNNPATERYRYYNEEDL